MTHRDAPLSVEGRRRLVVRCQTRPIAHVATEWVSHEHVLLNWVKRYRTFEAALFGPCASQCPAAPHSAQGRRWSALLLAIKTASGSEPGRPSWRATSAV